MNKGLGELKKYLPRHYRKEVAEKFNCSVHLVGMVARGVCTNWPILSHLIEIAKENKKLADDLERVNKTIRKEDRK